MSDRDRRPRSRSRDRFSGGSDSRGNYRDSYQNERHDYGRGASGGGRFERRDGGNFGGGRDKATRHDARNQGRGGRDRGPSAGGSNQNMGSVQSIEQLIRHHPEMSDEAILRITHPPYSERDRSDHLADQNAYKKPTLDAWRVQQRVGVEINRNVRANFFKLNPRLLPPTIFHYNIAIYRYKQGELMMDVDLSRESDSALNTAVMKAFIHAQPTLRYSSVDAKSIYLIYDGKSSLYSVTAIEALMVQGDVALSEQQGGQTFNVILQPVDINHEVLSILSNSTTFSSASCRQSSQMLPQALDIAALSFARWQQGDTTPTWLFSGNKAFKSDGQSFSFESVQALLGRLGYFASVRCTASGPALIADVSYTCFLKGGLLTNLLVMTANYERSGIEEFYRSNMRSFDNVETNPLFNKLLEVMTNVKIRITHLNHTKRLKKFSYPADDIRTRFLYDDKHMVTVAEYFALKSQTDSRYFSLKYPHLPTVNIGKNKVDNKPILVPMEVVVVMEGQVRNKPPTQVASELIRYAAMKPTQRFALLTNTGNDGLLGNIQRDEVTASFGLHDIATRPMQVKAMILPPPRLQYAQGRTVEVGLKGSWNIGSNQFAVSPPAVDNTRRVFGYALLITTANNNRGGGNNNAVNQQDLNRIEDFQRTIENDSRRLGTPLQECARYTIVNGANVNEIISICRQLKTNNGARLVIVILQNDCFYGNVKFVCDGMQLPSQCVRWRNVVQKTPSGYHTSLMIKIQHKLGGVGHTLAPRLPSRPVNRSKQEEEDDEESFENPPKSISWLFEEPCMVMGVDVSHPNDGHGDGNNNAAGDSVAAVVGSMDGMLGQYCAHISRCSVSNTEPVPNLEIAMDSLLNAFARRNEGKIPKHIIIYRDGVADNQFEQVLETEIRAYREAIFMRGIDPASVKIAVVMCQKRHHTRLVYEMNANEGGGYVNPAVGLCVDGRDFVLNPSLAAASVNNDDPDAHGSINTPNTNEFYLNSHAAILGTAKPCKYTLIYDEIGLKLTEIELLTYWMTHLYCRCTKSVSYATPAYYAHWAARRGKVLLAAGMTGVELQELSEKWMEEDVPASMYFA